jgi:homocysteine S-methyltransferase
LDQGDVSDFARRYHALKRDYPGIRVLGGCCGTDHTHISAICEACMPADSNRGALHTRAA